ncbi:hypothetical protein [Paraburkholderia sp. SIMBA_030]|uniref:hypothetical protein n=1 Tax=Paraburkholderia sp. SIMBA_030 TaxID=3085773 RepID=UPI00397C26EA
MLESFERLECALHLVDLEQANEDDRRFLEVAVATCGNVPAFADDVNLDPHAVLETHATLRANKRAENEGDDLAALDALVAAEAQIVALLFGRVGGVFAVDDARPCSLI